MAALQKPFDEATALCAIAKTSPFADWQDTDKTGARLLVMGVVCNPPRRGLQVRIYMSRGSKVQRRTIDFGLWDSTSGVLERIYQLTIADSKSPTHMEEGELWFGSHEHMGEKATKLNHMDSVDFHAALEYFCQRTSLLIEDGPIEDPQAFSLS